MKLQQAQASFLPLPHYAWAHSLAGEHCHSSVSMLASCQPEPHVPAVMPGQIHHHACWRSCRSSRVHRHQHRGMPASEWGEGSTQPAASGSISACLRLPTAWLAGGSLLPNSSLCSCLAKTASGSRDGTQVAAGSGLSCAPEPQESSGWLAGWLAGYCLLPHLQCRSWRPAPAASLRPGRSKSASHFQ